ncbi:phosphoglucomutase [Treponema sp. HNW]|uniref:phosphoglucomutase n=1 Tax=Treponema sp. HNW TaxID=3116654 RepID=UPI003D11E8E4
MKSAFDTAYKSMILSASGWRMVFASSGNEEDASPELTEEKGAIAVLAAHAFAKYITDKKGKNRTVVVGTDTRPTGKAIADRMIRGLAASGVQVRFIGVSAAPEIMSYAKTADGFAYISASHNPIGHNGIKFGLADGGVIPAEEASQVIQFFRTLCESDNPEAEAERIFALCPAEAADKIYAESPAYKKEALGYYRNFTRLVVSAQSEKTQQDAFFTEIKTALQKSPLSAVCDMNGSARCLSIDKDFLSENGVGFYAINDTAGSIAHAIIPEPENLVHCAREMERLQRAGTSSALLGYMPDCDGDRGNIVYWNEKTQSCEVLAAQEVFALSVLSELAFRCRQNGAEKTAVSVNGATSMRIDEIARAFGAEVHRAEVGEANIVNLARSLRKSGYAVPILGEGSNGGNITHPAAVRDPMNTLFALIKLLTIKDSEGHKGLFHLWCSLSGREHLYKENFSFADIIASLPAYTTTGVSDQRALMKIRDKNHAELKRRFQRIFTEEWPQKKESLRAYGIESWEAAATVGTKEIVNPEDFGVSGTGGLKIIFKDGQNKKTAFMWMRGSATEPVFRILCDVRGTNKKAEAELIDWERSMLAKADTL